jgi:hypothetical protein
MRDFCFDAEIGRAGLAESGDTLSWAFMARRVTELREQSTASLTRDGVEPLELRSIARRDCLRCGHRISGRRR